MSIHYSVPGFELTTCWLWVSFSSPVLPPKKITLIVKKRWLKRWPPFKPIRVQPNKYTCLLQIWTYQSQSTRHLHSEIFLNKINNSNRQLNENFIFKKIRKSMIIKIQIYIYINLIHKIIIYNPWLVKIFLRSHRKLWKIFKWFIRVRLKQII